jgi:hypothetical protein
MFDPAHWGGAQWVLVTWWAFQAGSRVLFKLGGYSTRKSWGYWFAVGVIDNVTLAATFGLGRVLAMSRAKLPNRRNGATLKVPFTMAQEKQVNLLVTVGFDEQNRVKEVFCADFKAGTDMHAIVMDASILLSRLFQHGDTPREVASALSKGSLVQTIALAVADEDETPK